MNAIRFEKVNSAHKELIFSWLAKPHVQEFWDNTPEHQDDILNFMDGRRVPSNYCGGKYLYWLAFANNQPYALLMTIQETYQDDIRELKRSYLSRTGHTYGIDFMIGNTEYLGKGYGAKTLVAFTHFLRDEFDQKADAFLIDPACNNPRAKRVYEKAGFQHVADFIMEGSVSGSGKPHHLLIKKFLPTVTLVPATLNEYPIIQNMARFYVYDFSRACGYTSDEWELPPDGLFESIDYKNYFENSQRKAYLITIYGNIAGFILAYHTIDNTNSTWTIDEFFILGRYQGLGVGQEAAKKIWQLYPGRWQLSVIPENTPAVFFWEKTIKKFTNNHFTKEIKLVDYDTALPKRIIFTLNSDVA